jgi:hypothetical protein
MYQHRIYGWLRVDALKPNENRRLFHCYCGVSMPFNFVYTSTSQRDSESPISAVERRLIDFQKTKISIFAKGFWPAAEYVAGDTIRELKTRSASVINVPVGICLKT